jgi:integrase
MWIETLKSGRVRGGYLDPVTRRKVQRTFDYGYEAEAWAVAAEGAAKNGHAAPQEAAGAPLAAPVAPSAAPALYAPQSAAERPACPTVAEYAERFLTARRGHLTRSTWDGYEIQLRRGVCSSRLAGTRLDDLTREDLDEWLSTMLDEEVGRPTINRRLKVFRILVNYAIDNGVMHRDPSRGIAFLPTDVRAMRVLDAEEEARLLAECTTPEARAQVLLALDAGLRWGEVAGLAVDAIEGEYLHVRQVVERVTQRVRRYPKGKRARVVPMTERLREALASVALVAEVRGPDALLFARIVEGEARPIDPHNWHRDLWRGVTHRAKINRRGARFRFHDLRHTYGSRLAAAGVVRSEIATLMGHADEETTAIYIHAGTDGHRLALVRAALAPAV